ncbi:ABC transporter substrate-binding protein [Rhodoferax antarcticus]|uniref:Putative periplasmic component of ABC-type transport system n=1 Tax=Rhodoferax antarcticus ANT.BR TaxID=1111071 RepID=A0A1Q8YC16_9BURK|nr:PhnD/SsuA/transferrin family substrate-binding protein [Rhodoferax antarcticus]APW46565.1 ABC transporter substrate-binding protein [Rhodoferax antarcticus]MCW2313623.1 NitT/TauT family transport system substrate-binding protein [Rhodoferax antarcticus]OLP05631.1 putative periplasmic component of ABC-type transport system [Rhodoferax antarcticus ANT.BR]
MTALPAQAAGKRPSLVLAGPPASVSTPLIHMIESGALKDIADKVEFRVWKDPDQLRVMALSGQADFVALPTNVAANLYNRSVKLRLLNVSTWGVLWMVSRDGQAKTLSDFRGKEIAMPFRADMPDIVFALLAEKQGLNAKKDFKLRYVASPLDAMQLLVTRRVDHALLAEPAVSMALRKTKSFPISLIAPDLHRSVDLQQEWGRLHQREARIPQAGIAAVGQAVLDEELQTKIMAAYDKSLSWCHKNALACGEMVAKRVDLLSAEAVADSLAVSQLRHVPTAAAQPELQFFFERLHSANPALIGGKLPDGAFYGP